MAIDEAIMHAVAAGSVPPTLRFYGWDPPALSVGYFQNVAREVDRAACESIGVDVVRRPTGGRAVLHDVEVTYSLVVPEENPVIPKGITESYRAISEGMVHGLLRLGLDARMVSLRRRRESAGIAAGADGAGGPAAPGGTGDAGGDAAGVPAGEAAWDATGDAVEDAAGDAAVEVPGDAPDETGPEAPGGGDGGQRDGVAGALSRRYQVTIEAPDRRASSAACFDAPSWYEVTAGGKKVVGSAQVRRHGVLLQHGSIPLELDADKLFACLRFPSEEARRRARDLLLAKATSIRAALGRPISFMEVSEAIVAGLGEVLGVEIEPGELTEAERGRAERLAKEKYGTLDWPEKMRAEEFQTA